MLAEHKQPAIWCISLGFGLQLIGAFLQSSASYRLAPFLLCASAGLLYFGCSELAEGKGWKAGQQCPGPQGGRFGEARHPPAEEARSLPSWRQGGLWKVLVTPPCA